MAESASTHEQLPALQLCILLPLKPCITGSDANTSNAAVQGHCQSFADWYFPPSDLWEMTIKYKPASFLLQKNQNQRCQLTINWKIMRANETARVQTFQCSDRSLKGTENELAWVWQQKKRHSRHWKVGTRLSEKEQRTDWQTALYEKE